MRFTDPDGMWPDWLDNLGKQAKSASITVSNGVSNAMNSLPKIDINAKITIGAQVGVKAGSLLSANVNLASATIGESKISTSKGVVTKQETSVLGVNVRNGKSDGVPIESKVGVTLFGKSASASSSFNATFPKYGDTQISNSVQTTENGFSAAPTTDSKLQVDRSPGVVVSSNNTTNYSHGQQTGNGEETSATYGGAFIIGVEFKITIKD